VTSGEVEQRMERAASNSSDTRETHANGHLLDTADDV
jgi:hypothetical protein